MWGLLHFYEGAESGERLEVFDLEHDWKVIYPLTNQAVFRFNPLSLEPKAVLRL